MNYLVTLLTGRTQQKRTRLAKFNQLHLFYPLILTKSGSNMLNRHTLSKNNIHTRPIDVERKYQTSSTDVRIGQYWKVHLLIIHDFIALWTMSELHQNYLVRERHLGGYSTYVYNSRDIHHIS